MMRKDILESLSCLREGSLEQKLVRSRSALKTYSMETKTDLSLVATFDESLIVIDNSSQELAELRLENGIVTGMKRLGLLKQKIVDDPASEKVLKVMDSLSKEVSDLKESCIVGIRRKMWDRLHIIENRNSAINELRVLINRCEIILECIDKSSKIQDYVKKTKFWLESLVRIKFTPSDGQLDGFRRTVRDLDVLTEWEIS